MTSELSEAILNIANCRMCPTFASIVYGRNKDYDYICNNLNYDLKRDIERVYILLIEWYSMDLAEEFYIIHKEIFDKLKAERIKVPVCKSNWQQCDFRCQFFKGGKCNYDKSK